MGSERGGDQDRWRKRWRAEISWGGNLWPSGLADGNGSKCPFAFSVEVRVQSFVGMVVELPEE